MEHSFDELEQAFIASRQGKKAESTIEGYQYAIDRFRSFLRAYDISIDDLDAGTDIVVSFPEDTDISTSKLSDNNILDYYLRHDLEVEEYQNSTVRTNFGYLRAFINFLFQEKHIDRNPVERVTLGDYVDYGKTRQQEEVGEDFVAVSDKEFQKLLQSVPAPEFRNRILLRLMYNCGLRRNEVITLDGYIDEDNNVHGDLDMEKNKLTVPAVKSDDRRSIWFSNKMRTQLQIWMTTHRASWSSHANTDALLVGQNGRLSKTRVNDIVKIAAENAGIQKVLYEDHSGRDRHKVHAHALRHGFAMRFVENSGGSDGQGADIYALSKLMGHHSISVTEKYLDAQDEYLRTQSLSYAPDV